MTRNEFNVIIDNVPQYRAQFRLLRVPSWLAQAGVKPNDLCIYDDRYFQFTLEDGSHVSFNLGYGDLEFIDYVNTNQEW